MNTRFFLIIPLFFGVSNLCRAETQQDQEYGTRAWHWATSTVVSWRAEARKLPKPSDTASDTSDSQLEQQQGRKVEEQRLLKIKEHSDLDYTMLEAALEKRIKSLTHITVTSMIRGGCVIGGVISIDQSSLADDDVKCYIMNISANFVENLDLLLADCLTTDPDCYQFFYESSSQILNCTITVFAGNRPNPNLLFQKCENEDYILVLEKEFGQNNNKIFFDELGIISLLTRKIIH